MARLVYWDKAGQEHTANVGREHPDVTIGRHPECVVRTSNGSVSRRHCTIRFTPDGIELADKGSSSGTYINNRRVNRQFLIDGDEIYCGSFMLRFHAENTTSHTLENDVPTAIQGRLVFVDDTGAECTVLLNTNTPIALVGRANECQIRTADGSVSRRHSEFKYVQGIFEVSDQGSFNGTYVNGQKVTRKSLHHGDEVNCGRLTINFYQEEAPQSAAVPVSGGYAPPQGKPASGMIPDYFANQPVSAVSETILPSDPAPNIAPAPIIAQATLAPQVAPVYSSTVDDQIGALEETIESLNAENDALRRELDESRDQLEERSRGLEKELNQKKMVIDSFQERYDQLKLQADDQLSQIEAYRDELRQKREAIEDQEYKLNLIQDANERGNSQVAVLIEENANLKVEVNQLERQVSEAERLSNLHEFELKRVQGELGGLQDMVSTEGNENAEAQNEISRLRQVLDVKEAHLNDAERELDALRGEVHAYREDADRNATDMERMLGELEDYRRRLDAAMRERDDTRQPPAAAGSNQSQVNDLKRSNRDQRNRIDELERTLEDLEAQLNTAQVHAHDTDAEDRHRAEREAMQRRIDELENALGDARRSQSNDEPLQRLRTRNQRLEAELDGLQEKLREAARAAANTSGGDDTGLRKAASETYELLNDVVSQIKNDMQLIQDYTVDIRKVYESYRRIDAATLQNTDRVRVEKTLRDMEPDVTFEELAHILSECVRSSEEMKSRLLDFKDTLLD